jgi:hypothetical protein
MVRQASVNYMPIYNNGASKYQEFANSANKNKVEQ